MKQKCQRLQLKKENKMQTIMITFLMVIVIIYFIVIITNALEKDRNKLIENLNKFEENGVTKKEGKG